MSKYQTDILHEYIESHCTDEPLLLGDLHRQTQLKALMPRMISGKTQGRFLSMLSKAIRPGRILELGTFTGYASFFLADGLSESGKLYSIDKNDELFYLIKPILDQHPRRDQINFVHANAADELEKLHEAWDLVFIDADKENYPYYYKKIIPRMKAGGWLIADNVLWEQKVADASCNDKATLALRKFNDLVQEDERVENVLLPMRDGLMAIRKL